jgi:hypothetical protein
MAALLPLGVYAQTSSYYTFSQTTGTYADIEPVGATNLISNFTKNSESFPLPANFKLFGQGQGANLLVGRDGWVSAQTTSRFFAYDPFMIIGSKPYVARSQTSAISARVDVTSQDTIVKVQWKNITIQDHPTGDYLNFQLWLYKKAQTMEFHYGPSLITPGPSDSFDVVMVHFNDDFSTCYESQQIYGSGTSVQIEKNPDSLRLYNGAAPNGTIFKFERIIPAGIQSVKDDLGLKVYPNPATGIVNIQVQGKADYTLCDMAGKVIVKAEVDQQAQIDISNMPNGLYLLRVGNETVKLVNQ